jgi:ubiquinone/menaquinone biosynthesis C-methylase UbiE
VTGLDIEPEAIDLARDLAQASPAAERLRFVCADVHELPFADASFDIVVSRGSIYFWRDHTRALQEVMRVLRPDGVAFIGGGSGKYLTMDEFAKQRKGGHAPIGRPKTQRRSRVVIPLPNGKVAEASVSVDLSVSDWAFPFPVASYDAEMTRAGIADYRVLSEGGQWVEFRKPAPQP